MGEPWRHRAACNGLDTNHWFPETSRNLKPQHRAAIAICKSCPVSMPCLQHSLEQPEIHGIWGGLTEPQRRRMRGARAPKPIPHGTNAGYSRHVFYGEDACEDCKAAHNRYQNARRRIRQRARTRHDIDIEEVS